ncbi:MAG: AbrB family transcriptional regulator, partial [Bacteroidia bacterium]|nr:AbrB family transcriptional regulator [Bacteroidia bacterium]
MNIVLLIFLHLAALVGGLIFIRLKAPAGALVGSMAFVVLFLFITKVEINYYFTLRFLAQSLSGLIIGLGFSKSNLTTLKRMAKPTLALIVTIIVVNIGFSFIMEATTKLNYMTSLFATGLGGVADLALIATDFNADLEPVALLQLFRLVTVVVVFPPLVKISLKHKKIISHEDLPTVVKKGKVENYFITLAVALLGSAIFHITRVPAGAILGSIFA